MTPDDLMWVNLIAAIPLTLIGSLLHFAYDWSRHHRVVAVFAAVNESYWEHIKIAFWPVLVWFIVQFGIGGWRMPGFVPAATIALYAIPVAMITIVFGYKRVLKKNVLWIDIVAFLITVTVSLAAFALVAVELAASVWTIVLSVLFLAALCGAFIRYTIEPPREPDFFVDPTNARYGLSAHPES